MCGVWPPVDSAPPDLQGPVHSCPDSTVSKYRRTHSRSSDDRNVGEFDSTQNRGTSTRSHERNSVFMLSNLIPSFLLLERVKAFFAF